MEKLSLTETQQSQMKSLREALGQEMQALRANESLTVKEQRDQRERLMQDHRRQIQSLLTSEQKQQLQAAQTSARNEKLARMSSRLNLSPDQKKKVEALHAEGWQKMEAIRDNPALDRLARQEALKEVQTTMREQTKQVLSPEQQAQWKNFMQSGGPRNTGCMQRPRPGYHRPSGAPFML
jgi:Spy/CpxP family protein refolding chaperone